MVAAAVAAQDSGSQTTDTTNHPISLTSIGTIASGDWLGVWKVFDNGNTVPTVDAGLTQQYNAAHSGNGFKTWIGYRQADGTEGSSFSCTTDLSENSRHILWRLTGHEDPSTQAPELFTADSVSNSVNPNPPSTGTLGGGSKDYRVLAGCTVDTGNMSASVYPYTNNNLFVSGGTTGDGVSTGGCDDAATASSIDPGTFTVNVARPWTGITWIIHPDGGGGTTFNQSVGGTLSFAGALDPAALFARTVVGTLSFIGALSKETAKALTGVVSFDGALTKQMQKLLQGSLSFVGGLLANKIFVQAVAGALDFVGTLATNFIPAGAGPTIRRMWRSVWSRVWKDPAKSEEDT